MTRISKKKLIALLAAGAMVVGAGVTATAVGISNYNAETQALCATALEQSQKALDAQQASTKAADAALKAVKSTKLPKDGGTSADYAKRPAVEAIKAVPAKDGKPKVKAVDARPSGADFIKNVTNAREKLFKVDVANSDTDELVVTTECADRDQAKAITASSDDTIKQVAELDIATEALLADFATFQGDEAKRIAAEKKAAAEKAAAEAAAAAAAQAAAEQAAAETYYEPDYSGGGGYDGGGYDGGWNDGGGYSGGGGSNTGGGGGNSGGGGGGGGSDNGGGGNIDMDWGGGGCPAGMTCYG